MVTRYQTNHFIYFVYNFNKNISSIDKQINLLPLLRIHNVWLWIVPVWSLFDQEAANAGEDMLTHRFRFSDFCGKMCRCADNSLKWTKLKVSHVMNERISIIRINLHTTIVKQSTYKNYLDYWTISQERCTYSD